MDPRDAFDLTLKAFSLRASDIAEESGIAPESISRYRKKRADMNSLTVQKLITALPKAARLFFMSLTFEPDAMYKVTEEGSRYLTKHVREQQASYGEGEGEGEGDDDQLSQEGSDSGSDSDPV
ncbi:MAG: hypothetical protein AAGF24_05705 [Cyanobacteria bacterium P01_H01_bin.121]